MSNSKDLERLWKLQTKLNMLVLDDKRDPLRVILALQTIIEEKQMKFIPYLHPRQKEGGFIGGFDFEEHLKAEGLLDRTISLEHKEIKKCIADPSTYPEEYKGKAIFLWKSQRDTGRDRSVAYLVWGGERVVVSWCWLESRWDGLNPVLLASS